MHRHQQKRRDLVDARGVLVDAEERPRAGRQPGGRDPAADPCDDAQQAERERQHAQQGEQRPERGAGEQPPVGDDGQPRPGRGGSSRGGH